MTNNGDAREIPSPPSGERVRVRGRHTANTRTTASRDFARQLRHKSTDAEKRLWRLLRDHRFNDFKFRYEH